jgi:hypothetical protein
MHPRLTELFIAAAGKALSSVEIERSSSHQHELNGVRSLRQILGEPGEPRSFEARFIAINDELETFDCDGTLTWYDARRTNPKRASEARLYYSAPNPVIESSAVGDRLLLAQQADGNLFVIVTPRNSTIDEQLRSLFGIDDLGHRFSVGAADAGATLSLTDTDILEALGLTVDWTDNDALDGLLEAFGGVFPPTADFSAYARAHTLAVDPLCNPDAALVAWMTTEEILFRTLERHLITAALASASGDVEAVLDIAQRAFQRRRARAGQALENHMEELLTAHLIPYTRGGRTEGTKKPDFIFPGIHEYSNPAWPSSHLLMLGAKTTCRDRWRQVLTEANRIPEKHLLTLEAPISSTQLDEMASERLTLVIPAPLHAKFPKVDRERLLTVSQWLATSRAIAKDVSV